MSQQAISVYAESTPNPAVLKFVANKNLVLEGSYEFKNIEEAKHSALSSQLFHFPFVKQVFISANYVAVTKFDVVEWQDVMHELREMVRGWAADGKEIVNEEAMAALKEAPVETNSDEPKPAAFIVPDPKDLEGIDKRIAEILDEFVKPAVQGDGGNIAFSKYSEGRVEVLLQGACSGCPSSTMTLKSGIETLLKDMLPNQINEVVAINT